MWRSRISWTCVIGVIVSMSVWMASFCIMRWSIGHKWHLVLVYIKLNERIHAFQNGVHKLQHVSVTTLDSGIQLLLQINPCADNLWKLLTYFVRTSLNNAFDRHFYLTIYGSVNFKRAHPPRAFVGHLSPCRSLRWGFVRKPQPGRGTLVNSFRRG